MLTLPTGAANDELLSPIAQSGGEFCVATD